METKMHCVTMVTKLNPRYRVFIILWSNTHFVYVHVQMYKQCGMIASNGNGSRQSNTARFYGNKQSLPLLLVKKILYLGPVVKYLNMFMLL